MCFSAQASFTASVVLAAIGYKTLKKASTQQERLLAAIPLLFAMQQFFEGMIWINFSHFTLPDFLFKLGKNGYLFFAFLVWPIWYPLSVYVLENDPLRKKLIGSFLAMGILLCSYYVYMGVWNNDITVKVVNYRLQYNPRVDFEGFKPLYLMCIIMPIFLSSYPGLRWIGWPGLLSFVVAFYYFEYAFVSVWCFFASLISLLIYKVLADNAETQKRGEDVSA